MSLLYMYFFIKITNKKDDEFIAETKTLMDTMLIPLCKYVQTLNDCIIAKEILTEKCVKDGKFIIHKAYVQDYYRLRVYLLGKINILQLKL